MPPVLKVPGPFPVKVTIDLGICRVVQAVVHRARQSICKPVRRRETVAQLTKAAAEFEYEALVKRIALRAYPRGFLDSLIGPERRDRGRCNTDRCTGRVVILSYNSNKRRSRTRIGRIQV